MQGRVTNVTEHVFGSELAADVTASDETITVADLADFDYEGGTLAIGDEEIAYTLDEDSTGTIDLLAPITSDYAAGERVEIFPRTVERRAYFQAPDQEEELHARVPLRWWDAVPLGSRGDEEHSEQIEAAQFDEGVLVLIDVVGAELAVDVDYTDETTVPGSPLEETDGIPPASSPTPTVDGALRSLYVTWSAIVNEDPVTYDVHLDDSSGFTPGPSTLVGSTDGTFAKIDQQPDGSPFDYGSPDETGIGTVPYYVRLVARDADGAAAAGTEGSGLPRQVTSPDIAAENVFAEHVLADTALFTKLQALLIISNTLKTATSGARWEADADGMRIYDSNDDLAVSLPTDGTDLFEFIGHVLAQGLDIEAGTGASPAADRKARWLSGSDAILEVFAYLFSGEAHSRLISTEPTGTDIAQLDLNAESGARSARATFKTDGSAAAASASQLLELFIGAEHYLLDGSGVSSFARLVGGGGFAGAGTGKVEIKDGEIVKLQDSSDASDFLQLLTAAKLRLKIGSDTVTGNGAAIRTDSVAHGLGATPIFAIAVPINASGGVPQNRMTSQVDSWDGTNVVFNFRTNNDSTWTATVSYVWLAIG